MMEFFIPQNFQCATEDEYNGSSVFFEETLDVQNMNPTEQTDTLNSIFREMESRVADQNISDNFSRLFSFVRHAGDPGTLSKEARYVLGERLAVNLRELNKLAARFLVRHTTDPSFDTACVSLRSMTKMYAFLICQLLRSVYQGFDDVQPSALARRAKRRRGADTPASIDEDDSGIPTVVREMCLAALNEVFSVDLAKMWRKTNDVVEGPLTQLMLRTALHLMSQRNNIEGIHAEADADADKNPVAVGLIHFFVSIVARLGRSFCLEIPGAQSLEIVVSPMLERLSKGEHSLQYGRFVTRLVATVDGASSEQHEDLTSGRHWVHVFLGIFFRELSNVSLTDVVGDGSAAKSVALLLEELALHRLSVIAVFFDSFIEPLLSSESYEIRKAAMTCQCELICQKLSSNVTNGAFGIQALDPTVLRLIKLQGSELSQTTDAHAETDFAALRLKILRGLWTRLRDLNPFARLHCVKMWRSLVERRAVPPSFYIPLTTEAVGRLEDRNHLVRRASLSLLETCLGASWFGTVLQPQLLEKARAEHIETLRDRFSNTPQEGCSSFEAFLEDRRQSAKQIDERLVSGEALSDDHADTSYNGQLSIVLLWDRAVEFGDLMRVALQRATRLLQSTIGTDVIESIAFIVAASHLKVDGAVRSALTAFSLIFSEEVNVKIAVCKAFVDMFVNFPGLSQSNVPVKSLHLARVHKMNAMLQQATEGDIFAMEEILEMIKREQGPILVNEKFLDVIVSLLEESPDASDTPIRCRERRTAMQLYSILAGTLPRDVQQRKVGFLDLMDLYSDDNVLVGHIFDALGKESRHASFVAIEEARLPVADDPNSHPLLQRALHQLCRPTTCLGTWMVMASRVIDFVHLCYRTPITIYTMVVSHYLKGFSADGSLEEAALQPRNNGRVAQLFFIAGQSAIKHLVTIDNNEREQMRLIDERSKAVPVAATRGSGRKDDVDVMHKELGLMSTAHQRFELIEACAAAKAEMLTSAQSPWSTVARLLIRCLMSKEIAANSSMLTTVAMTALMKLCVANEKFCRENLRLIFTFLANKNEGWAIKTNTIIALGDLLCVFPNALEPYLELEGTGFYALLSDPDRRVRSITVQVCTFLILNDMLKIRDHLHTIVRLIADEDALIAGNAEQFIHHLAVKQKRHIGNLIPPLVGQLSDCSMSHETFQRAMRILLSKIEGDKVIESLVDKLSSRFTRFIDERNTSKKACESRMLARNVAFCISEMDCSSERVVKKLMSEGCYARYKQWLRDATVLQYFQSVVTRVKRLLSTTERRDKAAVDEWEARLLNDAAISSTRTKRSKNDSSEDDNDEE